MECGAFGDMPRVAGSGPRKQLKQRRERQRETFKQVKRSSLLLATSLDCTAFDKTWEVEEEVASSI